MAWDMYDFRYGNLGKIPKASLDTPLQTTVKVARLLKHRNELYKLGFASKPTISNVYRNVIKKQYPKYTGPNPPWVGGGQAGSHVRVQGRPMRAVGQFTNIPKGYLTNKANQKAILARTAKVAKGVAKVAKVGRIATPVGAALLAYDAAKWAVQWHKDNPDYMDTKYKSSHQYLNVNTPGKFGVDY